MINAHNDVVPNTTAAAVNTHTQPPKKKIHAIKANAKNFLMLTVLPWSGTYPCHYAVLPFLGVPYIASLVALLAVVSNVVHAARQHQG